jgi:tellurite resistance protein
MSQEYLDAMHDGCDRIRMIGEELYNLSDAFRATGNVRVANQLRELAGMSYAEANGIREAVGKEINDQFKQSQEASANVLNAALAGAIAQGEAAQEGFELGVEVGKGKKK